MRIFHYTSFTKIGAILGKQQGEPAGLEPRRKIGGLEMDNPKAVFALLEPIPDNWVKNPHFPTTWRTLVHDLRVKGGGAILLEADVEGEKDKVFVGERAHMEGLLYTDKTLIPPQFLHEHIRDAGKAFRASMTPVEEYVARQQTGEGFSLPEVVILHPIPVERIVVSTQQPLIEDDLALRKGEDRGYLIHLISRGWAQSELQAWRTVYEERRGSLEHQARSKEAF